jgi:hypothetical protein
MLVAEEDDSEVDSALSGVRTFFRKRAIGRTTKADKNRIASLLDDLLRWRRRFNESVPFVLERRVGMK